MIGAGSVVTKDIPANTLAYGNPAKAVRKIENWHHLKDGVFITFSNLGILSNICLTPNDIYIRRRIDYIYIYIIVSKGGLLEKEKFVSNLYYIDHLLIAEYFSFFI